MTMNSTVIPLRHPRLVFHPATPDGTSHGVLHVKPAFICLRVIVGSVVRARLVVMRREQPHHLTSGRTLGGPNHNPACWRVQGSEGRDPSWEHGVFQPRFRSVTIHPGSGGSAQGRSADGLHAGQ
jgi:hypothetical protein